MSSIRNHVNTPLVNEDCSKMLMINVDITITYAAMTFNAFLGSLGSKAFKFEHVAVALDFKC